jgi:transcriptional regulator with XRE-family HTH domain
LRFALTPFLPEEYLVSRTQYSRIENGEAIPNTAEVIALRKILGVSLIWLLEGEEEEA